jgi:PII-like signaling protein
MTMQGAFLKLYVSQTARHGGNLLYEWLLEEAHGCGIPGGSVYRAIAGYGRHNRLHEEHFFELAGDLPVVVEFFAADAAIDGLLERVAQENVSIFYIRQPAIGGVTAG